MKRILCGYLLKVEKNKTVRVKNSNFKFSFPYFTVEMLINVCGSSLEFIFLIDFYQKEIFIRC